MKQAIQPITILMSIQHWLCRVERLSEVVPLCAVDDFRFADKSTERRQNCGEQKAANNFIVNSFFTEI